MNLLVHNGVRGDYINAGTWGGLNMPRISHSSQRALDKSPLELWLAQVAIIDNLFIAVILAF